VASEAINQQHLNKQRNNKNQLSQVVEVVDFKRVILHENSELKINEIF